MTKASIIVRPIATEDELTEHIARSQRTFAPDAPPEIREVWQQNTVIEPGYRPEQIRAAFVDGRQVGGYRIPEHQLRIGVARIATGCIGVVATESAQRKQGIATALMQDAIAYAKAHQYPLLLLNGIPKFYYRYGYTDVFDVTTYEIDRAAILAAAESSYTVRVATLDDAGSILALYTHHYSSYIGSFARTLDEQGYLLRHRRAPENPVLLAVDATGQARGYLWLADGAERSQGKEFVADNWEAASALLLHHARMFEGVDAPEMLTYWLSPNMPILQECIDHLEVANTSTWHDPAYGWVVRGESYHHRYAGWMARLIDLSALAQAMLPEWQARWHRVLASWFGEVQIQVADEACTLRIQDRTIQLVDTTESSAATTVLTPEQFTQILFGYRTIDQALEQSVEPEVRRVLKILFPTVVPWIPSSDWF